MKKITALSIATGLILGSWASVYAVEDSTSVEVQPDTNEISAELRSAFEDSGFPQELQETIQSYREAQSQLREELQAQIDALENPTEEEVQEIVDQFRQDHAALIEEQKELAQSIRGTVAEIRMEHAPERPDMPERVQSAQNELKQARQELKQQREQWRQEIKDASTAEERRELVELIREKQRDEIQNLIELRRSLREEIRETGNGNRRVGGEG